MLFIKYAGMSNGDLLFAERLTIDWHVESYLELEVNKLLDLLCAIIFFLFKGFDLILSA